MGYSIRQLEWAAGFLEGEGSFLASGSGRTTPTVQAVQVQKEPLERLLNFFGGKLYFVARKDNPNANNYWRWVLSTSYAAGLMMTLFSLMSPRRKGQIVKALTAWKSGKGEGYNSRTTHCPKGHEYNEENTYRKKSNGYRICKACAKVFNAAAYLKRKAA